MKNEQHAKARNLFFQTEFTQQQIAALIGISEKTLSLWANEGRWRRLKQLAKETPAEMIDEMYNEVHRINEAIRSREPGKQFATPQQAEIRRKTFASVKYVQEQQASVSHAEVLINFTTYVLRRNVEDAQLLTKYADDYMKREKMFGEEDKPRPYNLPKDPLSDFMDTIAPDE